MWTEHSQFIFEYHFYYAALLPRRGPHIASHSVCLSVPLSLPSVTSRHLANNDTHVLFGTRWGHPYFSARTEGRISYGHLGRTDSCWISYTVTLSEKKYIIQTFLGSVTSTALVTFIRVIFLSTFYPKQDSWTNLQCLRLPYVLHC